MAAVRLAHRALPGTRMAYTALLEEHGGSLLPLLVASGLPSLLHCMLGYHMRLPFRALVLGGELALGLAQVADFCACTRLAGSPLGRALVRSVHRAFCGALLLLHWLPGPAGAGRRPLAATAADDWEATCWAALSMLQLCLAFVLPLGVLAVLECRRQPLPVGRWLCCGLLAVGAYLFMALIWRILGSLSSSAV